MDEKKGSTQTKAEVATEGPWQGGPLVPATQPPPKCSGWIPATCNQRDTTNIRVIQYIGSPEKKINRLKRGHSGRGMLTAQPPYLSNSTDLPVSRIQVRHYRNALRGGGIRTPPEEGELQA